MSYSLLPSLEHIALIKITVILLNHNDIRTIILEYSHLRRTLLQLLENELLKKSQQLLLPGPLKEKVVALIKPIGTEILEWIDYNRQEGGLGKIMPNAFYWTPQGTVDFKKTAETLIVDENFDIRKRYILACIYCFEEEIPKLWSQLSMEDRRLYYKEGSRLYYCSSHPYLVVHWTYEINGQLSEMHRLTYSNNSIYQFALKKAIESYNVDATKYFFQKLTPGEKEACLEEFIEADLDDHYKSFAEILRFLLSAMNEEQKVEVIEGNCFIILNCFLKWPLQNLFMEMANLMWNYLDEYESHKILKNIVDLVIKGYKDYDYRSLISQFLQGLPKAHKRYLVYKNTIEPVLLSKLLKIKDLKDFHLILKEATVEECIQIFSFRGVKPFKNDKFFSMPLLIQAFASSSKDLTRFVKEFKQIIVSSRSKKEIDKEKAMWNKLFRKFSYIIKNNRNTIEEYDSGSPKRRRSSRIHGHIKKSIENGCQM